MLAQFPPLTALEVTKVRVDGTVLIVELTPSMRPPEGCDFGADGAQLAARQRDESEQAAKAAEAEARRKEAEQQAEVDEAREEAKRNAERAKQAKQSERTNKVQMQAKLGAVQRRVAVLETVVAEARQAEAEAKATAATDGEARAAMEAEVEARKAEAEACKQAAKAAEEKAEKAQELEQAEASRRQVAEEKTGAANWQLKLAKARAEKIKKQAEGGGNQGGGGGAGGGGSAALDNSQYLYDDEDGVDLNVPVGEMNPLQAMAMLRKTGETDPTTAGQCFDQIVALCGADKKAKGEFAVRATRWVPSAVAAMRLSAREPLLQLSACRCLATVLRYPGIQDSATPAVPAIVKALLMLTEFGFKALR